MNDRAVSLLEQYDLEVSHTRKGRGAILCETDQGLLIFKEYGGNPEHLKLQNDFLQFLSQKTAVESESLIPTKEGELFVRDNDGVRYILKTFRDGRECNLHDNSECLQAIRLLAGLHLASARYGESLEERPNYSVAEEYAKRNRELKKIRKFLLRRSQKTWFELSLLGCFDGFYQQALEAQEGWEAYRSSVGEQGICALCHGDYQYHNLMVDQRGWFLINFERCTWDDPVRDLHLLLRKLLEKAHVVGVHIVFYEWTIYKDVRVLKNLLDLLPYRIAYLINETGPCNTIIGNKDPQHLGIDNGNTIFYDKGGLTHMVSPFMEKEELVALGKHIKEQI